MRTFIVIILLFVILLSEYAVNCMLLKKKSKRNAVHISTKLIGEGISPTVVSANPNSLDSFIRGSDNNFWQISYDNVNWSGWTKVSSSNPTSQTWGGDLGVCSSGNGRLDVFAKGSDNAMYHACRYNGVWLDWENLGDL